MPDNADLADLHRRASEAFGQRVDAVKPDQWDWATPCADWTVRDLVNHIVGENLWTPPLMAGKTLDEVGDAFDGDVVGEDPVGAYHRSSEPARAAVGEAGALGRTVHLSFGEAPAREYVWQLTADHLIHAWDLAQAVGTDDRLEPDVVDALQDWFTGKEPMYREAGIIGPPPQVSPEADEQTRLLARFGRSETLAAVERFNAAFNRHDVDGIMALMTDDCVFDNTGPAPDGRRYEGQAQVRQVWETLFGKSPSTHFDWEDVFASADRAVVRWTLHWDDGHVRGVDVLQLRDGKVAEKLSYVKG